MCKPLQLKSQSHNYMQSLQLVIAVGQQDNNAAGHVYCISDVTEASSGNISINHLQCLVFEVY